MQVLQQKNLSGVVTIPKEHLERDGVLEDGEFPDEQNLVVDRVGRQQYLVRMVEGGDVPDLEEAEVVQRVAAKVALERDLSHSTERKE
ncbi:hypothetical protein [Haloplanus aerogenes]|uniref:DUF8053 domain-containing protein n=1 Tax=Haloplanus aerogenes TaxID=660522 RepID=A0A3M0CJM8_9EURY|nr:hypothetical protein [Haloplanus aerogenes]AZH26843.1 hypothetical protein DU502_16325 [Haloplanus aerogenes]RMB09065.1 hypothetical protein ATH50_3435 [Haloplanus aerogenes]